MSKHKSLEVINGELLVFGEKLPRHPEYPWLFSATHLHKFCEPTLRRVAENNGKDPDKFYLAKRPGVWLQKNILSEDNEERVEAFAKFTRKRVQKYGVNLGFGLTARNLKVKIDEISSLETVCATTPGRYGGGSYLSLHALRDYATSFSIPELSEAFHKLFPSSAEEISSTVKKLSSTRKELEFSKYLAGLAQHHKAHLETQRPELGKYKVDFCFKSKTHGIWFIEFDENYHEARADEDLIRWKEIQNKYRSMDKLPKCGLFFTRVKEGDEYAFLAKFSEYLVSGCLDLIQVKEFIMSKKIKYSVEVWSDTFTDKRKIKFVVSTKEEFNFDAKKQSKETGGERRLTKACGDKQLLAIHPQKGINLATLGTTAKKFKDATGITEPLNDNLPIALIGERAVATELTAKSIEDSPSAKISPKEGLRIGFRCGIMAKQVLVDREAQELLFRNGLAKDKRARATAKKYGLLD